MLYVPNLLMQAAKIAANAAQMLKNQVGFITHMCFIIPYMSPAPQGDLKQ